MTAITLPARAAAPPRSLYDIRPGDIWRFLTTQPASYWLICIYLFFEYVRPQQIYESIAVLPWARTIIILCTLAMIIQQGWFRYHPPTDVLMGVFTAAVLLSSVFAFDPSTSFTNLISFLSWVLIYLLISNIVTTERRFLVFMLSFLFYNLKMSLFSVRSWAQIGFEFRDWGTSGAPGFFQNSGEFGIEMTVFLPLAMYFMLSLRRYWSPLKQVAFAVMPVTCVMGMVASSSRGALIGCGAVALLMLARSRYRVRGLIVVAVLAAIVIFIVPPEQKERFAVMGSDKTSLTRITYWRHGIEMFKDFPLLGIGFWNWMPYYEQTYGPGQLSHNIFIQAASELGIAGLGSFLALIVVTFVVNHRTRRIARRLTQGGFIEAMANGLDGALIGFLVSGFFVTVLYYPYFWINLSMTVALSVVARNRARAELARPARPSR